MRASLALRPGPAGPSDRTPPGRSRPIERPSTIAGVAGLV